MSINARRELHARYAALYREASGREKSAILTNFVEAGGYARKYAIKLLNGPDRSVQAARKPRRAIYGPTLLEALVVAWESANQICCKRLMPFLPELIPKLRSHGHLTLTDHEQSLLLSMSAATADRFLAKVRKSRRPAGFSMTKPGKLLKRSIRVKTFADWDETSPGFFEADLVSHSGPDASGSFLWTLTLTDVATGWTECLALLNRSGQTVVKALKDVAEVLPFPILGLDTDNGSEFINSELMNYCKASNITFTRGRAHRKNDQCFVEQKNGAVVRQAVGHSRLSGEQARRALAKLYSVLRVYTNLFQPSMKLLTKTRDGSKVQKTYRTAKTPLQRMVEAGSYPGEANLTNLFKALDPVQVLDQLKKHQAASLDFANLPAEFPGAPVLTSPTPGRHRTMFDSVQPLLHAWILADPGISSPAMLRKLQHAKPGEFDKTDRKSMYLYLKKWRAELIGDCPSLLAWPDATQLMDTDLQEPLDICGADLIGEGNIQSEATSPLLALVT